MLIKFRAECQRDVDKLLEIFPSECLISYKVTKQKIEKLRIPDVDCELEIINITIPDIVDLMSHISDSHVMQQTIALAENYTGIRDYQDYEHHQQRHVLLLNMLDELAADYISQTERHLSDTTVLELLKWAYQQTLEPTTIDK